MYATATATTATTTTTATTAAGTALFVGGSTHSPTEVLPVVNPFADESDINWTVADSNTARTSINSNSGSSSGRKSDSFLRKQLLTQQFHSRTSTSSCNSSGSARSGVVRSESNSPEYCDNVVADNDDDVDNDDDDDDQYDNWERVCASIDAPYKPSAVSATTSPVAASFDRKSIAHSRSSSSSLSSLCNSFPHPPRTPISPTAPVSPASPQVHFSQLRHVPTAESLAAFGRPDQQDLLRSQLERPGLRRFADQQVELSRHQEEKILLAKVLKTVDRMTRTRMPQQDCIPKSQLHQSQQHQSQRQYQIQQQQQQQQAQESRGQPKSSDGMTPSASATLFARFRQDGHGGNVLSSSTKKGVNVRHDMFPQPSISISQSETAAPVDAIATFQSRMAIQSLAAKQRSNPPISLQSTPSGTSLASRHRALAASLKI
ncbi:hypothetical protein GQ42DRAFT_163280 [Ramicandelaber brevisporus]|nr:hypothetical protein GQ42DRAFT_163280 [Ramicandelaber brevisporus]